MECFYRDLLRKMFSSLSYKRTDDVEISRKINVLRRKLSSHTYGH